MHDHQWRQALGPLLSDTEWTDTWFGTHSLPFRGLGLQDAIQGRFRISIYSDVIREADDDSHRFGMIMRDLPRRFHQESREGQLAALKDPPALTGTRWDALLAAVTEHIARLHDHAVPAWVDEPERFLRIPWVISDNPTVAADSVLYCPAAFIRHGALPDPTELDARGGEIHAWVPR